MADVLIVCVREDETLAKAFADMFERAGLHVGGAPGAPEDMRHCGAALVVWSQASIRSRAFLDAAQRAVNAGKAVVACLIAPPPPASINHAPAFDLSRWTGDPDDPVLDPLFFSVDRMVAAARAAAGVTAGATAREAPPAYAPQTPTAPPQAAPPPYARARSGASAAPAQPVRTTPPRNPSAYDATLRAPPTGYEPPATPRAPSAGRRAAPPPAAPQRRPEPARGQDAVAAEAQNWAAIRHSRDPEDFLRHLAEFGEDGAFAELAQMKLAELEAEARRRSKSSAAAARQSTQGGPQVRLDSPRAPQPPSQPRTAATRPVRPQAPRAPSLTDYAQPATARAEPRSAPPPAAFEPIRNERPPARQQPRRAEPPPQTWRDEPRYVERRPPPPAPRAGGGALRLFVLIAILGAGALAAGLFAGDRLGGLGLLSPKGETASGPADEWETAEETGGSSLGLEAEGGREVATASIDPPEVGQRESRANRGGPEPVAELAPAPAPRSAALEPTRERPQTQPATVSTTGPSPAATSESGLAPPITSVPQELTTLAPPPTEEQLRAAAVEPQRRATPPAPPPRAPQVVWASRPSGARINDFFPQRALRQDRGGRVELDCLLDASGVPRCAVARETPAGFGFGSAAIRASSQFRAAPTLDDGTPSAGAQTRLTIVFQAPNR